MEKETYAGYDRDLLIATHEAGHAVICHVLGYDFEAVSIEKDEVNGAYGYFRRSIITTAQECGRLDKQGQSYWMCDQIKITLSGGLAVYRLTNDVQTVGMMPDIDSARKLELMVVQNDEDKAKELDKALGSLTKGLISDERNWLAIVTLSNELIKRRKFTYTKAVKIIEKTFADYDAGKKTS